jgi:hypothetical protein
MPAKAGIHILIKSLMRHIMLDSRSRNGARCALLSGMTRADTDNNETLEKNHGKKREKRMSGIFFKLDKTTFCQHNQNHADYLLKITLK